MSENPLPGPFDPVIDLLSETELFRGLPRDELRRVATSSRRQRAQPGHVVLQAGESPSSCWVIGSGTVEVIGAGTPTRRRRGQIFGEAALTADRPSPVTVRAVDAVEVVVIPVAELRRVIPAETLRARARAATEAAIGSAEPVPAPPTDFAHDAASMVSRRMQRALMPRNAPRVQGYDIAAGTTAEDHGRGNSVWDAVPLPDGETALVVLDVRADGLPPALLLGMARGGLRAAAAAGAPVAELFRHTNAAMAAVLGHVSDQYVEGVLVVPRGDGVEWASAGRMPAGLLGRAGTLDLLASHGPPLGMMEGFRYGSETMEMGAGDAMLVLSSAPAGLFRGAADLVVQVQEKTAGEVVSTVHRGLRKAGGTEPPEVSVLYLRKH